jgi:hypothetical protein
MAGRFFRKHVGPNRGFWKLGWRCASADDGKARLQFDEAVFKFEPFAYRRCQKKKDEEDG